VYSTKDIASDITSGYLVLGDNPLGGFLQTPPASRLGAAKGLSPEQCGANEADTAVSRRLFGVGSANLRGMENPDNLCFVNSIVQVSM
jgi:hypothetical protein